MIGALKEEIKKSIKSGGKDKKKVRDQQIP